MTDIEEDALVEHQAVSPPVGRDQRDAAARRFGGTTRQAARVRKGDLAAAWPLRPEQHAEQRRDARTFESGEADDFS